MMEDLIDRKVAIESCMNHYEVGNKEQNSVIDWCVDMLTDLPSAERHGKWLHKNSTFKNQWLCSECGYTWYFDTKEASYCPHCGTKMDEVEQ